MIEDLVKAKDIAKALGVSVRYVLYLAKKEKWNKFYRKGPCGRGRGPYLFSASKLPVDIRNYVMPAVKAGEIKAFRPSPEIKSEADLVSEEYRKLLQDARKREGMLRYKKKKRTARYKEKIESLRLDLQDAKRAQRIRSLKNHPERIITRLYAKKYSPSQIAKKLGVSRQAVHATVYGEASCRIRAEIENILGIKSWS